VVIQFLEDMNNRIFNIILIIVLALVIGLFVSILVRLNSSNINPDVLYHTEYYEQIQTLKDSINKLKDIQTDDSVKTVETIKYVYIVKEKIENKIDTIIVEQADKDTIIQYVAEIIDTLQSVISNKDEIINKQDFIIDSLITLSFKLDDEFLNSSKKIASLNLEIDKYQKRSKRRGWIIGGVSITTAIVVTTLILAK
jgi:lipopolysaccharide export LptBFGC system permease protein LptF